MFGILEAVAVPHHGIYNSFEELMSALSERVTKEGYKVVKSRSHRVRAGGADGGANEINRCDLVCDRGGRPYRSQATKHKSSTKKTDCPWKAKAVLRKTMGGWVLTILCDQHNHAPGTPEPPSPPDISVNEDASEIVEGESEGPRPDPDTSVAMQIAGVPETALRLTGDTFQQFKNDYRKMTQTDRLGALSQLQLRIAAIYAIQNEEMQRNRRHEATQRRHSEIEEARRQRHLQKRSRRPMQPQAQQPRTQQGGGGLQGTPAQPSVSPGQGHQSGTPLQVHMQAQPQAQQHHQMQQPHLTQQQFQIPDSPSQQLMMNLALPQQPQYPPPAKRIRTTGPSTNNQQTP